MARLKKPVLIGDFQEFWKFLIIYTKSRTYGGFARFEVLKNTLVDVLYKKRGKYVRPFLHLGTVGLAFVAITVGPVISTSADEDTQAQDVTGMMSTPSYGSSFYTQQAEEVRQFRGGEIITHVVSEGETISSIANRYGLEVSTILWENDLTDKSTLKPGMELKILPLDGVRHTVTRGETIYSIGKKYGLEGSQVQVIVDYPFNEFLNDETFELATGQQIMIPDGVKKNTPVALPKRTTTATTYTADAGSVTALGSFVWPASGRITQGYKFYHKAIDIANSSAGPILASDAGVVVGAGWLDNYGYGNRVIVDHGNGFVTLYAHLSVIQVQTGQRVNRGDVLGQMGSTGKSTGTHLHFEIRQGGVLLNPSTFLQ